jgi:hypothetical protein
MKSLRRLAFDLVPHFDEADLRRLRSISEADFVMLLALHRAEEIAFRELVEAILRRDAA